MAIVSTLTNIRRQSQSTCGTQLDLCSFGLVGTFSRPSSLNNISFHSTSLDQVLRLNMPAKSQQRQAPRLTSSDQSSIRILGRGFGTRQGTHSLATSNSTLHTGAIGTTRKKGMM